MLQPGIRRGPIRCLLPANAKPGVQRLWQWQVPRWTCCGQSFCSFSRRWDRLQPRKPSLLPASSRSHGGGIDCGQESHCGFQASEGFHRCLMELEYSRENIPSGSRSHAGKVQWFPSQLKAGCVFYTRDVSTCIMLLVNQRTVSSFCISYPLTATQTLEKRIKQESCCSIRSFLSGTASSITGGLMRSKNSAWCSCLFHCRHQTQQRFQAVFSHLCSIGLRKVREPLRRVR